MISVGPSIKPHAGSSSGPPVVHLSEAPRGFKRQPPSMQFKFKPKDQKPRYVPKNYKPSKQSSSSCHKCGRMGHYTRDCQASAYIVEMNKELHKLINQNRESHAVLIPSPFNTDVDNYMALRTPMTQSVEAALLDNASTHT